ncbi:MAG: iron ABC transporter [Gemmataceae bacterium]|nr:iron ABC transporter [Gemmataceae bacterium]
MSYFALTELEIHRAILTIAVAAVCSVSCALLGCFLLLKRMSMLGDAIGHGVLPGIAVAFLVTGQLTSFSTLLGAMAFGVLTSVLSESLAASNVIAEDSSLGVVYTSMFALGVVLISTLARYVDLDTNCVFMGHLVFVSSNTFDGFAILGFEIPKAFPTMLLTLVLAVGFITVFWKELKLVAFDPNLALSMGYSPKLVNYLLTALIAGTTVSAFEAVGLILVLAVLIVPGASAHLLTDRLAPMLIWSAVFAVSASIIGYFAATRSAYALDISGMIAVVLGVQFALVVLFAPRHGLIAKWWRNLLLSVRIAEEEILATLFRAEEAGVAVYSLALKDHGLSSWVIGYAHRKLIQGGLLATSEIGLPTLTETGRRTARNLVRSHRLWESYAGAVLDVPADHVHSIAARIEHYIGPELQDELATTLDQPPNDPHGKSIPPK